MDRADRPRTAEDFPRLNQASFLQTFIAQAISLAEDTHTEAPAGVSRAIEQLGLSAGSCFESAYRSEYGLEDTLETGDYADLICQIKNRIGGQFSQTGSDGDAVRVVAHRCPFGEAVKQAPHLCRMTSSVFGGIAARNFGYAKVELASRIAAGDRVCDITVHLDRQAAQGAPGDEYHDEVRSRSSRAEQRHDSDVWCLSAGQATAESADLTIVARSEAMRRVLDTVDVAGPTPASVLIQGETGVGKELIARALHGRSQRTSGPFLAINCGAIPEGLIESTLFGHEKGAFTGACEIHRGYFERAAGGTLFLDEVDSLPLQSQVRLMRVLQGSGYERVGGRSTLQADVRVVAAAGSQLQELLSSGLFRRDLYYRLNVVAIHIPPLRERREDIAPLVPRILARVAERYGKAPPVVGSSAMRRLLAYSWPGNVRELENVLERACLFTRGPIIHDLELEHEGTAHRRPSLKGVREQAAAEAERTLLAQCLLEHRGEVTRVAADLQVSTRAVYQRMRAHGLETAHYRCE